MYTLTAAGRATICPTGVSALSLNDCLSLPVLRAHLALCLPALQTQVQHTQLQGACQSLGK